MDMEENKMLRRAFSVVLAATLAVTLLPAGALSFAEEAALLSDEVGLPISGEYPEGEQSAGGG